MEKMTSANEFKSDQLKELCERLRTARFALGTQSEVSKMMNIDQGHLSKMETGKRLPSDTYISRLARYAKKSHTEETLWLGMGGYLPWTRMPSITQIKNELQIYCQDIAKDSYPSLILDYRFGIWAINRTGYNIFGFDKMSEFMARFFTMFHILFSNHAFSATEESILNLTTSYPEKTLQQQITLFKGFNLNRRHEPFYVTYLKYMRDTLGENTQSYRLFENLWDKKTDIVNHRENLQLDDADIQISGIPDISKKSTSVIYRQRLQQTFHLPQFAILRFEPEDDENARKTLLQLKNRDDRGILKLWELTDIEPLLERYDSLNLIESLKP